MIFALAIQLSHTQHLNFEQTYQQTAKSLSGLSFYNQSSFSNSNLFAFHWITVSNTASGTDHLKLFVLEDAVNSYPLNTIIGETFTNINLNSLEVYDVSVTDSDAQITIFGSISGQNGDNFFNQRPFKLTADINNNKLILKDSIRLFLYLE